MQSIKFDKERSYLRTGIQKIEVDETNINFINGLAVVKATVYCFEMEYNFGSYIPKTYTFTCEGIINENFEEAFQAKYETDINKYFIFRKENQKIMRFGPNDFVVETEQINQHKVEKSFAHIRLINKEPTIINENLKDFSLTSNENLAILDNQFYYVAVAQYKGPKFKSLKECKDIPGEYIVEDEIIIPKDPNDPHDYTIIDHLTFRMNKEFQITSYIYSSLEPELPLDIQSQTYKEVREERMVQLLDKKRKYKERYDSLNNPFGRNR